MRDRAPEDVEALLSKVNVLVGGVDNDILYAAAAAVGFYLSSRDLPKSALVGMLVIAVLKLRSTTTTVSIEDVEELDEQMRADAMRRLEQQVAPETDE